MGQRSYWLANVLHRQRRPIDAISLLDALLQSTESTYSNGVRARAPPIAARQDTSKGISMLLRLTTARHYDWSLT